MSRNELFDLLDQGPVLGDGAMGTQLIDAGLAPGECGMAWNVDRPQVIRQIHRAYCDAGSRLLTTNTFQGSRTALSQHGLDEQTTSLNRAGAEVARDAGDGEALVLGDAGPFGGFLEPVGDTTEEELRAVFIEQFEALRAGGADVALLETMSDPREVATAIAAARSVADWPIIASFTFEKPAVGDAFHTMMGTSVALAIKSAIDAGTDVLGANCGTSLDLDDYLRLAEQLADASQGMPLMLQANAGSPQVIDGKSVHPATPEQMAAFVPDLLARGVRIVGGCCGTTPEHLRAMGNAMRGVSA